MTQTALIAALYTVLTLVLPMASFGTIQLRFSEVLTILPAFSKTAIAGLTLGCALANAIGVAMGLNTAGVWDILFGTAATLLASVLSYALCRVKWKGLPLLSVWPPVLVNAVVIGVELCWLVLGEVTLDGTALMAVQVGVGQLLPCVFGGLLLYGVLQKSGIAQKIFEDR